MTKKEKLFYARYMKLSVEEGVAEGEARGEAKGTIRTIISFLRMN